MDKWNTVHNSKDKPSSKNDAQHMANDLMTLRLREGQAVSELKEHKQRVMELETQVSHKNRNSTKLKAKQIKLLGSHAPSSPVRK